MELVLTVIAALALGMEFFYFAALGVYALMRRVDLRKGSEAKIDISILKPLKGVSPHLEDNIQSFLRLENRGQVQIIFVIADEQDPAIEVLEKALARTPTQHEIVVLKGIQGRGKNPKNSNLLVAREMARHPWIYVSDADVRLPVRHLQGLAFQTRGNPNVYVTSMPVVRDLATPFARVMGIGTNLDGIQYFALCQALRRPLIFGGSNLFSRELDARSRGLDSTADLITDDLALVSFFSSARGESRLSLEPVDVMVGAISFQEFSKTWTRWLTITRTMAPEIFWPAPLSWSWQLLFLVALLTPSFVALQISASFLLLRALRFLLIMLSVGERVDRILQQLVALPVYDVLTPYFWIRATLAKRVSFGGKLLHFNRRGEIVS